MKIKCKTKILTNIKLVQEADILALQLFYMQVCLHFLPMDDLGSSRVWSGSEKISGELVNNTSPPLSGLKKASKEAFT